jgi:Protein of unknown function (DUF2782)
MRRLVALIALIALGIVVPVAAQKPPELEPIPEPPPPPPGATEVTPEPEVTIIQRGETKEEQFRINGRLYMIKVTPPHGRPYYLIDSKGDGTFARQESMDSGLRVPMWVIKEF